MPFKWGEGIKYLGGTKETEAAEIAAIADLVNDHIKRISSETNQPPDRPQHRKSLAATNATFSICDNIPEELQVGFFGIKQVYNCFVRFSNASALMAADNEHDLRGCAVRIKLGNYKFHDFLMTNAEIHHAKDAVVAMWTSYLLYKPSMFHKVTGIARLAAKFGPITAAKILSTLSKQIKEPVESLATETYWSRSAYKFGSVAVRFRLSPMQMKSTVIQETCESLSNELASRVLTQEITFEFQVQTYVNKDKTPIEDSTKSWAWQEPDSCSPFITIATLVINKGADLKQFDLIDTMKFNPWNVSDSSIFEPLGNMNRARKHVYTASAEARNPR